MMGDTVLRRNKDDRPDKALSVQIALAEFTKLRDEITTRTTIQWTIVGLNVTGSGVVAGFALADPSRRQLLLMLPLFTPSLGMLFIDHGFNILRIGRFIESKIAPVLRNAAADQGLLNHETEAYARGSRIALRLLPFGIPLVLLFNVVPLAALVIVLPAVREGWAWTTWDIGVALSVTQMVFWAVFLAQPFRR
jgi:hypothetical protein